MSAGAGDRAISGSTGATRRLGARVGLVFFGVLLAGLLFDVALRLAPPTPVERLLPLPYRYDDLRRIATGETYIRFDPRLGWTVAPGSVQDADGVVYRSNMAGLRAEREYALEPPAGVRRIAAFGDSFTHCDEVNYPDCWTAQLERAWPGTEVLNFGVPAYGPDQAWLRYEQEAEQYRPCAVLIGYWVENINRVVNRFRPFYQPDTGIALSKPRFLLDGGELRLLGNPVTDPGQLHDLSWVERTLGPHDHWYYPGLFAARLSDFFMPTRLVRTTAYRMHTREPEFSVTDDRVQWAYETQEEAYEIAGRVLIEFAREVTRDGRTPVVVVFPRKNDVIAARRGEDRPHEPLLEWLKDERITVIDLTDGLGKEARSVGVERLIDKHFRARGNEVIAATLAERLPRLVQPTCGT